MKSEKLITLLSNGARSAVLIVDVLTGDIEAVTLREAVTPFVAQTVKEQPRRYMYCFVDVKTQQVVFVENEIADISSATKGVIRKNVREAIAEAQSQKK